MSNNLGLVILSKFKLFCKHCTLHGVFYFYKTRSLWLYCMWIIIIGSSMSLCAYLSHMIWIKFVANPTFTVVESTHYSMDNVILPAVAVCVSKIDKGPNTENITRILSLRGYDEDKINNFYQSFNDIKNNNYNPENYIKEMHNILERLGYTYDILLEKLSKPCHLLIRECMWRSKTVECSRMFRKIFTVMGYCCQFDVKYFSMEANDSVNLEAGKEVSEALEITVNTETISTSGISSDSVPNLYVFDSQNKLTLLDSSIMLTARTYFDIAVAVWIIESSEDVRSLSLTNRKCFLIETTENEADSYQRCITLYLLQKVVTHCRCLPFKYSAEELKLEEFPPCTWERLKCIYNMLDKVQSHIRHIMSEKECYQKCDLVQYETKTSYYNIDKNDNQTQHSCRVAVHFADNTCIKYRREVLYTWDQMLANLGAIFGLCLGGSIVSVIELLWFLLELLFTILYRQQIKVVPHNNRTNKIFTLTSKQTQNQFKSKYPYIN